MTDSNVFSHAEGEGYSSQLIHDSSPTVMKKVAIFFLMSFCHCLRKPSAGGEPGKTQWQLFKLNVKKTTKENIDDLNTLVKLSLAITGFVNPFKI